MKDSKKKILKRNILGSKKSLLLFALGAVLVFADYLLKKFFVSHSYYFKLFSIHYVKNTGISFGLLQGTSVIMIFAALLFLFFLWFFRKEFEGCRFCLVLLSAGTIGNMLDRIFLGHVVDYFDLGWFPVFNLADAMISIGTAGIVFVFLKEIISERRKKEKTKFNRAKN